MTMKMEEIREKARELLKGSCRVCPQCNGRACAGEVPGMGGCGSGASFMENAAALAAYKLRLRTLHDVTLADTTFSVFGMKYTSPVMVAPMTGAAYNMKGAIEEEQLIRALEEGAKRAGTVPWIGDGAQSEMYETGLRTLKTLGLRGIATIKPRPNPVIIDCIKRAEDANCFAIAVDVDAAGYGAKGINPLGLSPKTADDLAQLINATELPFILKGIMNADEALLAVSVGAKGIVVSNHGGRVLDNTPGTADMLPDITAAVKGKIQIFADGAVRTGLDTLKMLALGADAVLIGRPLLIAAVGGGAEGVALYLDRVKHELSTAMIMTGAASLDDISSRLLFRK